MIETMEITANGHSNTERIRILTLMPLMYALAGFFHLPSMSFESTNSVAMAHPTDSNIV